MIIWYLLVSVIYCAVYVAWLKTLSSDDERYFFYGDLKFEYIMLCILGTILWPFVIPFLIVQSIAFKILTKKQNKTK